MNQRMQSHFFWGPHSPLSALTSCALMVLASTRLAFALFCAGAILWVYILSALVYFFAKDIMPARGKHIVLLFLSSLMASFYLLLTGFINPLMVIGNWILVVLVPVCLAGSEALPQLEDAAPGEAVSRVSLEAIGLCLVVVALSLIREPLGFGALSFPGGAGGLFELFSTEGEGFFPVRILSVSSGGLLLLGYVCAVYRGFRQMNTGKGEEQ